MKHLALSLSLALCTSVGMSSAFAQTSGSSASSSTHSDAGAIASTGNITFESSEIPRSQRLHTTPSVYAPPSMFGGANNCMGSDTFSIGVTGVGAGGSISSESKNCNTREDTAIWAKFGMMDVALIRFACFGADENKQAFEAAGHSCDEAYATLESKKKKNVSDERYSGDDPVVLKRLGLTK